jgi:predicted PurR-regulated permease PerM
MNKTSFLQRVVAAIASVCTALLLLTAVVSLAEPPQATSGTQLAKATDPAAEPTGSARR